MEIVVVRLRLNTEQKILFYFMNKSLPTYILLPQDYYDLEYYKVTYPFQKIRYYRTRHVFLGLSVYARPGLFATVVWDTLYE